MKTLLNYIKRNSKNLTLGILSVAVITSYYIAIDQSIKKRREQNKQISELNNEKNNLKKDYEKLQTEKISLKYDYINEIVKNNQLLETNLSLLQKNKNLQEKNNKQKIEEINQLEKYITLQEELIKEKQNVSFLNDKIVKEQLTYLSGKMPSLILPEEVASSPVSDEVVNCKNNFEFNKLVNKYDSLSKEIKNLSYEESIKKINNIPFAVSYLSNFIPSITKTLSFKEIHNSDSLDCLNYSLAMASVLSDDGFNPYILTMHSGENLGHAVFLYKSDKNNKYGILDINKGAYQEPPKYDSLEQIINYFEKDFGKKMSWAIVRFNDDSYINDKENLRNIAVYLVKDMKENNKFP